MAAVAEADSCDGEFSDALSGGPSARTSIDGGAAANGDGAAAKVASVRAAVAEQEARGVPEDERWAVQVRCGACLAGWLASRPQPCSSLWLGTAAGQSCASPTVSTVC